MERRYFGDRDSWGLSRTSSLTLEGELVESLKSGLHTLSSTQVAFYASCIKSGGELVCCCCGQGFELGAGIQQSYWLRCRASVDNRACRDQIIRDILVLQIMGYISFVQRAGIFLYIVSVLIL